MKYPELKGLSKSNITEYHKQWRKLNKVTHMKQIYDWRKANAERYRFNDRMYKANNKIKNIEWLKIYLKINIISCMRCGYNKNFGCIDGHHIDPIIKENQRDHLSTWLSWSLEKFKHKIINSKIIFLCRNCHGELHLGDWKLEDIKCSD